MEEPRRPRDRAWPDEVSAGTDPGTERRTSDERRRGARGLYSPTCVFWVSFLSFLGAAILMAVNYWRLGRKAAAFVTVGAAAVLLMLVLPLLFPFLGGLKVAVVHFGVPVALLVTAELLQGQQYEKHTREVGERASALGAVAVAIVTLVAQAAFLVAVAKLQAGSD